MKSCRLTRDEPSRGERLQNEILRRRLEKFEYSLEYSLEYSS